MRWKAADVGRVAGKTAGKLWRDAINVAVNRPHEADGRKYIMHLAERLVQAALDGDMAAMKEIGDRVDGKAIQHVAGEDGGALVVKVVKFADADPSG